MYLFFSSMIRPPPTPTLFPYTTLFRSVHLSLRGEIKHRVEVNRGFGAWTAFADQPRPHRIMRSEEHTSELQSRFDLVCRLLLEKKNFTFSLTSSVLAVALARPSLRPLA